MPPNEFVMWIWFLWPFIFAFILIIYYLIKRSRFKNINPKVPSLEDKFYCPNCKTPVNKEIGICPNCNRKI